MLIKISLLLNARKYSLSEFSFSRYLDYETYWPSHGNVCDWFANALFELGVSLLELGDFWKFSDYNTILLFLWVYKE